MRKSELPMRTDYLRHGVRVALLDRRFEFDVERALGLHDNSKLTVFLDDVVPPAIRRHSHDR
jgi:hypothetical protein